MSRSDGTTRIGTCVLLVCMYLCDLYCLSTCPQRKLTNRMKYGRGTARLPIFLFVNDLVDVFFFPFLTQKMAVTITIIIIDGTLVKIFFPDSCKIHLLIPYFCTACEKINIVSTENSGIKAFTASVVH